MDRISSKLNAVGCRLATLTDWDAAVFEFDPHEVELMAQMEHDAWVKQLTSEGWHFAAVMSIRPPKTHPHLVAWSKLPDAEKLKNRTSVRELPRLPGQGWLPDRALRVIIMAQAGFMSYSVKDRTGADAVCATLESKKTVA